MIKLTGPGSIPDRGHMGDAGFDLRVTSAYKIEPRSFIDMDCGISIELPSHLWARICGRSSTVRKRGLMVVEGVIDAGYRGPLFIGVWNLTNHSVWVSKEDRLAQLIPHLNISDTVTFKRVEMLSESTRGTNGFGSTGE